MGELVLISAGRGPGAKEQRARATSDARILFFTGVRYQRRRTRRPPARAIPRAAVGRHGRRRRRPAQAARIAPRPILDNSSCHFRPPPLAAAAGHLSPTRGAHLKGWHKMTNTPAARPVMRVFLPALRQTARLDPDLLKDAALGRSHRAKLGKAKLKQRDRPDARSARRSRRLPHRHHPRLRHRRGRDGAVVAAGRAPGRHAGVGKLRRRLGRPTSSSSSSSPTRA